MVRDQLERRAPQEAVSPVPGDAARLAPPPLDYLDAVDLGTVITVIIAALSLALSALVWQRQRQSEGRAHFTIEWESSSSLVYLNHGPGAARNVTLKSDTHDDIEQDSAYIGAFQAMRVTGIFRGLMSPPVAEVTLAWDDNRRARQSIVINVPEPPHAPMPKPGREDELAKAVRRLARLEAKAEITEQARRWSRFGRG